MDVLIPVEKSLRLSD